MQNLLVDPCSAELGEVRHVHLLDITVEDELQRHVSERDLTRGGQAYLLPATHELLHEEGGTLFLWRQVDLGYRRNEWSQERGEHVD